MEVAFIQVRSRGWRGQPSGLRYRALSRHGASARLFEQRIKRLGHWIELHSTCFISIHRAAS
jgi:hypothetical protein